MSDTLKLRKRKEVAAVNEDGIMKMSFTANEDGEIVNRYCRACVELQNEVERLHKEIAELEAVAEAIDITTKDEEDKINQKVTHECAMRSQTRARLYEVRCALDRLVKKRTAKSIAGAKEILNKSVHWCSNESVKT